MSDASGRTVFTQSTMSETSQRLLGIAGDIETNFQTAKTAVQELAPDFQGSAGEASREFYEQLNAQATAFHESFESYARAVGIAAETLGEANSQVQGMFRR